MVLRLQGFVTDGVSLDFIGSQGQIRKFIFPPGSDAVYDDLFDIFVVLVDDTQPPGKGWLVRMIIPCPVIWTQRMTSWRAFFAKVIQDKKVVELDAQAELAPALIARAERYVLSLDLFIRLYQAWTNDSQHSGLYHGGASFDC